MEGFAFQYLGKKIENVEIKKKSRKKNLEIWAKSPPIKNGAKRSPSIRTALTRWVMFGKMAGGDNPGPGRPEENWAQCLVDASGCEILGRK